MILSIKVKVLISTLTERINQGELDLVKCMWNKQRMTNLMK